MRNFPDDFDTASFSSSVRKDLFYNPNWISRKIFHLPPERYKWTVFIYDPSISSLYAIAKHRGLADTADEAKSGKG